MKKVKILIILKRRHDYNGIIHSQIGTSTGLYNSASYIHKMLEQSGIDCDIVVVRDNNDIDREVTKHKPTHVIIEALWVVPEKFYTLSKLHPHVEWIIRLHSNIPFLANEGIAMKWIGEYVEHPKVSVALNSERALEEIRFYLRNKMGWDKNETSERVIYLPNFYPQEYKKKKYDKRKDVINIGCFGAIRPLKNHLEQAFAAIKFADKIGKKLAFHINIGRTEQKGEPIFKNLVELFNQLNNENYTLVNHEWMPRHDFLKLCHRMDIGLQVSFSETFNIVSADLISQGVPVIGSSEIPWLDYRYCANPTQSDDIYNKLLRTNRFPKFNVRTNQCLLTQYTNKTRKIWKEYFTEEKDTNKRGLFR